MDHPNHRSSHVLPTPRSGGLGIFFAFWLTSLLLVFFPESMAFNASNSEFSLRNLQTDFISLPLLFLSSVMLFTVGILDDFTPSTRRTRLITQIVASGIFLGSIRSKLALVWEEYLDKLAHFFGSNIFSGVGYFQDVAISIVFCVLLFGIVWFINLYNFMDGLNGIATLEAIFLLSAIAFFCFQSILTNESPATSFLIPGILILISSSLGFLIWNFPTARVFLGDSGSNLIGFLIAAFGLWAVLLGHISIFTCLLLSSLFWLDATLTLFLRWSKGEKITEAHRSHLYQILSRKWSSHTKVVNTYTLINFVILFPMALLSEKFVGLGFYLLLINILIYSIFYFSIQKEAIHHGT
ncbi:MAG: glycosyltransferase family 4 protein [Leptospiraceae bacterium]|nr:glycosyltransferase family 4 protein [Leptospiraceae bacterium]